MTDTRSITAGTPVRAVMAPRRWSHRRRRRPQENVFILNLVPLLDCVFMLLLFLIVATRFTTPEGFLPAKLPAAMAAAAVSELEVPRTPVRLYLAADPARAGACLVRIDDKEAAPVAAGELVARLSELFAQPGYGERTPVYLTTADEVSWDHVVNVYNAALTASFQRIFFVRP